MIAVLCNANGSTECGSDGYVKIDGRLTIKNQIERAREYRELFKKHFRYKYDAWTHVMFVRSIRDLPKPGNQARLPRRYSF